LIYGAGIDRSLAPIARFARRWRVLPVPVGATGMRQPVHARDLAGACVSALENSATHGVIYELGGGERLSFEQMIRRLRRCVAGPVVSLPIPLAALHAAAVFSARGMPGRAAVVRLRQSLTADNSAALRDFGYAPGPFDPAGVLPP
jgi:nucleoside-diphosphate-sugar epimerase